MKAAQAQLVRDAVSQGGKGELGRLRVGFVGSAVSERLPRIISAYRQQFPRVELELQETTSAEIVEAIEARKFDVGLVPGVVLGALLSSLLAGEFRFEGFDGPATMRRAMIGAALMGFGGMLAGGCAIGAGVTGGSIFVATAWLALFCMWVGAVATDMVAGEGRLRRLA